MRAPNRMNALQHLRVDRTSRGVVAVGEESILYTFEELSGHFCVCFCAFCHAFFCPFCLIYLQYDEVIQENLPYQHFHQLNDERINE